MLQDLKDRLLRWRQETDDAFLEPASVERLKAEIESTFADGQYRRPDGWSYNDYLAPAVPPWLKESGVRDQP